MAAARASLPLIPFILLALSYTSKSQATENEQERRTLLRVKSEWGNPLALDSWTGSASAAPHCNWSGIQCTDGSVTGISLPTQGLSESIPASICDLKNLSYIDLTNNFIPGAFPTSLYNCSNLEYLNISQNLFVGVIPSDIYLMSPRLTDLILSSNNFTGDIPASIGRLPAIRLLFLNGNLFNGSFPAEIGNLSNLESLDLAYNPFAPASIPPEFGNLMKLTALMMTKSNLVGEIPNSLQNLTEIVQLDLSWNSINGTIPGWVWNLKKLENLYLYANKLTGEINGTIGALGLVGIDISINRLTGTMPEDIGKLQNLQVLFMYFNRLSGEIPASIGRLPALTDIRLFGNNLSGVLPPELGKHSDISNIEVCNNMISGVLPAGLCASRALTSLVVFNNKLTGKLPASLGECPMLDDIQIYNNQFSGEIPSGLWSAVRLTTVLLHDNELSGTLPDQLPRHLSRLEIWNNRFSGNLPSSAPNLMVFLAKNNRFSGKILANFTRMSMLQVLSLGGNQIAGNIPAGIAKLRYLNDLDLSNNQLTGEIPAAIGSLPVLTSLDLSNNELSGNIPSELGKLKLNRLNLSANRLSGEVPASILTEANDQSFLSNPGLCSPSHLFNLHPCNQPQGVSHRSSLMVLILLLALAALLLVALAFGFFALRDYKRRKNGGDLATWKLTSFHSLDFTEANIVCGLTEDNLVGSGGAGKVYRVVLSNRSGETVAVKKIHNPVKQDAKLEKEFEAEVRILGSIRHANIVKLLCCISSVDSKLLVYEYMPNGSLDRWLHGKKRGGGGIPLVRGGSGRSVQALDWPTRLGIAIGAAQGLCYMHHDCSPPIIHRDVKSSNILVDSEMKARIADFGLARMLVKAGEPDSVSAVAGSFGYMAPECGYSRKVNEKIDVYSFGVVLLELTTGREANDGDDDDSNLAGWAWRHMQDGKRLIDAIDEDIRDPSYLDEMEAMYTLGLICTSTLSSSRPTMKQVLQVLLGCDRAMGMRDKPLWESEMAQLLQKKRSRHQRSSIADEDERDSGPASMV